MNIKILGLGLAIGCLSLSLVSCNGAKEKTKKASIPDVKVEQTKISTTPATTTKINPPANIDRLNPNDKSGQKVATTPDPKESAKKIAAYDRMIKLNPNDAKAYDNRAIAYKEQKQYPQALADFTKAAELFKVQKNTTGYQQAIAALQQVKSVMVK